MKRLLPILMLACVGCTTVHSGAGGWKMSVGTQFNMSYETNVEAQSDGLKTSTALTFVDEAWQPLIDWFAKWTDSDAKEAETAPDGG